VTLDEVKTNQVLTLQNFFHRCHRSRSRKIS
jgi:hypothetical protein